MSKSRQDKHPDYIGNGSLSGIFSQRVDITSFATDADALNCLNISYTPEIMPGGTPATVYNDVVMFAFGDLSRSTTMGTRRGITMAVDSSRYLEFDQLGVFGTERFQIVNHDIGTPTTAGCIVAYVGQT